MFTYIFQYIYNGMKKGQKIAETGSKVNLIHFLYANMQPGGSIVTYTVCSKEPHNPQNTGHIENNKKTFLENISTICVIYAIYASLLLTFQVSSSPSFVHILANPS